MTKRLMILIAAGAAVLVAATAATAKSTDTTITGAGSTFVQPLVAAWTPAIGKAFGYTVQYSGVGSGAGIAAITANQVDFGASDAPLNQAQQSACPDCIQIPWALSATAVAYNVSGAPTHLNLDGNTISKIFLGHDHQLERPGDQGAEQEREPARPEDHAGLPLGRLGNVLQLHRLPVVGERELEDQDRHVDAAGLPGGVRARKGSSGVAGLISRTNGAIGYVDVAYAIKNHIKFAAVRNKAGKFLFPSLRRIEAAAHRVPEGAREQRAAHREPAEVGDARLPDQHLHVRHRPQEERPRGRAAEDDLLGADPGSEARSSRRSSPSRSCRPTRRSWSRRRRR